MNWEGLTVLLNLGAVVFGAGGLVYAVNNLGKRMVGLEIEMKQMVTVMVTQGRQDERMTAMDERILAQGKRLDKFMEAQSQSMNNMARMVENTISRVNNLADRGLREDGGSGD